MKKIVLEEVGNVIDDMKFANAEKVETSFINDNVSIKWVRAYNIGKPFHIKERDWIGYVVTLDDEIYFVTGDTDANEDNVNVTCDVLFVPCGGKYTFDAEEAAEFTYKIRPRRVIPTHYTDIAGESKIGEIFKRATQRLIQDIEIEVIL